VVVPAGLSPGGWLLEMIERKTRTFTSFHIDTKKGYNDSG
jgi:hypothetical protein